MLNINNCYKKNTFNLKILKKSRNLAIMNEVILKTNKKYFIGSFNVKIHWSK